MKNKTFKIPEDANEQKNLEQFMDMSMEQIITIAILKGMSNIREGKTLKQVYEFIYEVEDE